MKRLAALATLFSIGPLAGCTGPEESRIAQLDPYVGGRPPRMRQIQPPPRPTPRIGRGGSPGESGWMPRRGVSSRWECIVIHHAASDKATPQGMRDWHVNGRGWDDLGYHFVIGNGVNYGDGQVYVGGRWRDQKHGAHCKTKNNYYNDHGVGICLIGDLQSRRPTQKQLDALAQLLSFLTAKCGIGRSKILTHGGITGKTACPGRYFSLNDVLRRMELRSAAMDPDLAEPPLIDEPILIPTAWQAR